MRFLSISTTLAALLILTTATPLSQRDIFLTSQTIQSIAPSTSSCANAPFPSECRTALVASRWISRSFRTYNVTSRAEQAALLAIMLFESGNFQYAKNHWPGVPGQGTRNMQSAAFNRLYAVSLYGEEKVNEAGSPEKVLEMVNADPESFASAAWFLRTQCEEEVRSGLQMGTKEGWEGYLTGCVGTTATEERNEGWTTVMQWMIIASCRSD